MDPNGILPDTSRSNNTWNRVSIEEMAGLSAANGSRLEPIRLDYEGTTPVSRTVLATSNEDSETWTIVADGTGEGPDSLVVDRETLRPVSQRLNTERADIQVTYTDTLVSGTAQAQGRSITFQKRTDGTVLFEGYRFHHPLTALSTIPLKPDFAAALEVFSLPRSVKTVRYRADGTETVETPTGTFETHVVKLSASGGGVSGTAYLRRQAPHHLLKLDVDRGGQTLTQKLTSISAPPSAKSQ